MKKTFRMIGLFLFVAILCVIAIILFYSHRETPIDTITLDSNLNAK